MAQIHVLEPRVYNLISAGEVVERPASVVKELVENSIDAGATEITVEITDGGIRSISVTDNGCGVDRENLPLAFLPHATSKLEYAADLDDISTLGFRGEALASIAAVSQVTFRSRTVDDEIGNEIRIDGGIVSEIVPVGMPLGSKITVDNLFYHTPARAKFLKKPKLEAAAVTQTVLQLILSNPTVRFGYLSDGKTVFRTNGTLDDAVCAVFERSVANALIPIDHTHNGIRVYGYIGHPSVAKHNKSHQITIVNGRSIQSDSVRAAVMQAYGHRLMTRMHPVYVLNLIVPFDRVDVNVHPTKSEVRFSDPNAIFSAVYHAVLQGIAQFDGYLDPNTASATVTQEKKSAQTEDVAQEPIKDIVAPKQYDKQPLEPQGISDKLSSMLQQSQSERVQSTISSHPTPSATEQFTRAPRVNSWTRPSVTAADSAGRIHARTEATPVRSNTQQTDLFETIEKQLERVPFRIVGQVFDTYLILETDTKVYLLDQHACHERVLYDELVAQFNRKQVVSQPLLLPYTLNCSPAQYEYLDSLREVLTSLGFEIEPFGELEYKVNCVPALLDRMNLKTFFDRLLADSRTLSGKNAELITDQLAQHACKSAIKAGDKLSEEQIAHLLENMQNGIPLQCPHGRPAVLAFTRQDFDKMFKRIV